MAKKEEKEEQLTPQQQKMKALMAAMQKIEKDSNQIQRAAVSIPSNIAEGMGRFSIKDRIRFIEISNGSLMEVMCQLEIAHSLGYITSEDLHVQETKIATIAKMILGLKKNLEEKNK